MGGVYRPVAMDVKVDTQGCDLDEDVPDLRFVLEVESSAAETELVLVVCLSMLKSGNGFCPGCLFEQHATSKFQLRSCKKAVRFPYEPAKTKCAQAHSEVGQGC